MQLNGANYDAVYAGFRWEIPQRFNIADAICLRHARGPLADAPALIEGESTGVATVHSFAELAADASRLANGLRALGVLRGDVVAIHLPQGRATLLSHLAIQIVGAIALPIATLFGPDAVRYRLIDSHAKLVIMEVERLEALAPALAGIETLQLALAVDCATADGPSVSGVRSHGFEQCLKSGQPETEVVATSADDPALLMYTSGTTGDPKGVVHAGRVLLGHLPGVALPHEMAPQAGDRFWTPADWAWAGGLLNVLFPALYWGLPVIAGRADRFDPEAAFAFMARHRVRNTFMPPTALRLMRQIPEPWLHHRYDLRSVATGGEALGEDMIAWGSETFGLTMNEFYGQTEVNLVLGNSSRLFPVRAGSMGRPIPGHDVRLVGPDGEPVGPGEEGVVAVRRPDPVMFLGYWNKPGATEAKFRGDWCLLGDVAVADEDGYIWFRGRDDDVINSAGYRIGPTEVEDCLMRHPAVKLAGVVGVPDDVRGEAVAAFIVPADTAKVEGNHASDVAAEIQTFVRERLAAHEYPRHIRFIDEMPMTVTGKIRRKDLRALDAATRVVPPDEQ